MGTDKAGPGGEHRDARDGASGGAGNDASDESRGNAGNDLSDGASDSARASTRRVFFALWPDEPLRSSFMHATHELARAAGGRLVAPRNLHVTLLFLGPVAEDRLTELTALAAEVRPRMSRHPRNCSSIASSIGGGRGYSSRPRVLQRAPRSPAHSPQSYSSAAAVQVLSGISSL